MQQADIEMQRKGVVDYWREKVEEETKRQSARKESTDRLKEMDIFLL